MPARFPLLQGTMQQALQCLQPECRHGSIKEKLHSQVVPTMSEVGELTYTVRAAVDAYAPTTWRDMLKNVEIIAASDRNAKKRTTSSGCRIFC